MRSPDARVEVVERLLIEIWEDVFETTGLDGGADFFELGGDSLAAAEIALATGARVEAEFGLEPEIDGVVMLLEFPTIRELAVRLCESG